MQGFRWVQLLPSHMVCNIATLGPVGFLGKAPGTNGSFLGLIWYTLFFYEAEPSSFVLLLLGSLYLAVGFCGEAAVRMFKHDPGEVILDELVALPICFIGLEDVMHRTPMWVVMLLGFGLFRFFDILKPLGIYKLQALKGGVGIVADDVAAAVASCLSLHLIFFLLSFWRP